MKKYFENFDKWRVLSMMLFVLAVVSGGGLMADAVESPLNAPGPDAADPSDGSHTAGNDPADPEVNDLKAPGDNLVGQDLTGTQMSSSQQTKEGNIDDEWDRNITQFQPWRNPLLSIARKVSRKQKIQNWTVKHGKVGGDTLDGTTTANISSAAVITLKSGTGAGANFNGNLKPFYKHSTIMVPSVPGYNKAGEVDGGLMLYVIDSNGRDEVKCMAVNGPLASGVTTRTDNLDDMVCPAIPSGTYLCAGAVAASESQLLVSPENFQPREEDFYVQKKLLNIVFTEDFEKVKKRIPWKVSDVKADAIYKYNMRAERTYWYGTQSRFWTTHKDGSEELVYTTKGILWQLTNTFAITKGQITKGDLIAISKLQHTTFSQSDHSYAFCGKNFMEWLLKVDLKDDNIINIRDYNSAELKLDFKRLKTTFGTTDFTYDQGLDMLGLSDVCVVLDLEGATRYVKTAEKERTNDMSKGAGEIRDAKRIIHEEADGIALRGYNSIFVGPTDIAFSLPDSQIRSAVVSSATLPENPTAGMVVALTADYELTIPSETEGEDPEVVPYEAGSVLEYKEGAWAPYTGYTTAV